MWLRRQISVTVTRLTGFSCNSSKKLFLITIRVYLTLASVFISVFLNEYLINRFYRSVDHLTFQPEIDDCIYFPFTIISLVIYICR